ncbi:MAG: hypothetical protein GXP46_01815 [Deferribacteres bacterium]|nr:hypothetical protein [Deferribacteres bacterium]
MKENKTAQVMIRLTQKEKQILKEEAQKRGISITALIRIILYEKIPRLRG